MTLDKSIGEVEGNGFNRNDTITRRSRIVEIVEPALVAACEILYDTNIKTLDSSANIEDVERGYAGVDIDYDTLSPKNKEIADGYFGGRSVSGDDMGVTSIRVPIRGVDVSCREISDLAVAEVDKFEFQPLTWAPIYTRSDMIERCELSVDEDMDSQELGEYFEGYTGIQVFHDSDNDVYFASKEHYDKLHATPGDFARMVADAKSG
jgi:hypothetical protein|tara:strand:+ start:345 stop:965 length:621 start_codon:yes stop_codon:yes gene_type:complete